MIEINKTNLFNNLKLSHHHAYLFYSSDKLLNQAVALNYAKKLICENANMCGSCNSCKQFNSGSYPDLTIINQDSVKVQDISKIINLLSTKPIAGSYKIVVILNAENINEIAQNKLLKSLEEPNASTIFILTSSKTDKLLPTILSRLNKIYIPTPDKNDKQLISEQYAIEGVQLQNYINQDSTLTEAVELSTNSNYSATIDAIFNLFFNLHTTADIPRVVGGLEQYDKNLFFVCMQDIFLNILNNKNKYDERLNQLKAEYPQHCVAKIAPLIDEAYKKQIANVNFTFILDNLLFDILKERFLCK